MAVTIYGDRINYNGYGDQYVAIGVGFGDIGSYVTAVNTDNVNYAQGSTCAGSNLKYGFSATGAWPSWGLSGNSAYPGGGSTLSGTWRKMSTGTSYYSYVVPVPAQGYTPAYTYTNYYWYPHIWVRIS